MQRRIRVKVKGSERYWGDTQLENTEPDCSIYGFECETSEVPTIRRIQFGLCTRPGFKTEDVDGFEQLQRFRSTQPGDMLTVTFRDPGGEVVVLSTIRGHTEGRSATFYPDNQRSAEILAVQNDTQGWKIAGHPSADCNNF